MRLQTKIILLIFFIAVSIGLSSSLLVSRLMFKALEKEMEKEGLILAQALAEHITLDVINHDILPTREVLREIVRRTKDVDFAYIIGFDGSIFTYSFEGGFPRALLNKTHEVLNSETIDRYTTEEGPIVEIGYPLINGMQARIYIGLNERNIYSQIKSIRNRIIYITFSIVLLGILLGIILSRRIVRPLERLSESMRTFGKGEAEDEIVLSGNGLEVNELIHSFNNMISGRKRVEEELRRVNRALKTLSGCNQAVLRAGEEADLLRDICRIIVEYGGYRMAWVGFAEQDEDKTVRVVAQAGYDDGYLGTVNITWADTEQGRGPTGTAIRTGKPCFAKNIPTDPEYTPWRAEATRRGYASSLSLPLTANAQPFGALNIYAAEPDAFDTEEVKLLTELSDDLVFGIKSLRARVKHKQTREEKEEIHAQLLHAQKMEAVGTLSAGIAHDFNNLLTAIIGYSEILLNRLDDRNPMRKDIKQIKKAGEQAASLTRQLLAFSRRQVLQPKVLDLNALVEGMDNMLRHLIGEDVDLITVLGPGLACVKADPGQIEHVIMNLAINARDAMPEGRKLTIMTENVTLDKVHCKTIPEARPGEFVCLSVADSGVGMDKEILQHIFEPFFSTKEAGKGTGLGLSVVYGIVKQHGGWINVYSEPGQGSVFKVYLPAFFAAADDKTEETVPLQGLRGNGERILLVEDETEVLEFATRVLAENNYSVFKAANAKEAMDIFEREKGDFHIVFSDVVLPDKNGLQLVNQLLSHKPGLRVLLSSGYADQKTQWPLIHKMGFRFLQKPYALSDLLRAVREVLEQAG